ncbi:MAG: M16 family metallopeptidase [Oligoflexia bacterium]
MKLSSFKVALTALLIATHALAVEIQVERDSKIPIAYVSLVLKGGSSSDPETKLGLTAFMSEMLARGTRKHTKEQIDLLLDQWGAEFGVETRAEYSIVRGAVLSSKLNEFLTLLEEILLEPVFPEKQMSKVKSETISALMAQQANDHALSAKFFSKALFQEHPYGRPISGIRKDIESIRRSDLLNQHALLMNPQHLLFMGAGDVDPGAFRAWAQGLSQRLPGRQTLQSIAPPVPLRSRRLQIVDKPNRTQTQIQIGQIGTLMTRPDYAALYLANAAFGGGSFSSRLMQEIRVKRGWSYGTSSSFKFGVQPRSWQVHLFPAEKDTAAALAHTLKMIEDLKERGITETEFALAQKAAINSAAFINDTPKKRIENRILEKTLGLEEGFFENFASKLKKVTRIEANQAMREFLSPEKLAISVVGTAAKIRSQLEVVSGTNPSDVVVVPYTAD